MKKLIFILLFIPSLLIGQSINIPWSGQIKSPVTKDTVVYSNVGDVSGYTCYCTFKMDSLTAPVKIDYGGSGYILYVSGTNITYSFAKWANDSLSYTLSNTAWRDTTNARGGRFATNVKPLPITNIVQTKSLGIRVTKLTNTGELFYNCLFVKP